MPGSARRAGLPGNGAYLDATAVNEKDDGRGYTSASPKVQTTPVVEMPRSGCYKEGSTRLRMWPRRQTQQRQQTA